MEECSDQNTERMETESIFLSSDDDNSDSDVDSEMSGTCDNDKGDVDESGDKSNTKRDTKSIAESNEMQIKEIVDKLIKSSEAPEEDLSTQILNYLCDFDWKGKLSESDVKNLEPIYNKICNEIATLPQISEILQLSMPYEEKCDIIEKILILYNAEPNTFEFLNLKRHLNKAIEKYRNFCISDTDYEKYKSIEESLITTEQKYKPLKYKIFDADLSLSNKSYLYQRYKYFSTLENTNSEYSKLHEWMEIAINIPNKMKPMHISANDTSYKINKYLWNVKELLDQEIYGLDMVKEQILFLLNNRITNNNAKGLSFALCGPPGTAKTSIIHTLSKAIELPFSQINLGGAKDVSYLCGHSYTYEGAVPGVIAQSLISLKYKNGIIYFDEFDKISNTPQGTEISRMLLHITDFTQNDKFHDRYVSNGIDIDLSNIWFIYSLNDKNLLDKTLSDRIPIITIDGYNKKEKFQITKTYIIPKALVNIGLMKKHIIFTDESIKYIIEIADRDSAKKTGVRQIKHLIDAILMKVNMLKTVSSRRGKKYKLKLSFSIPNFKLPMTITKELIDSLNINTNIEDNLSYKNMYI